MNDIFKLLIDQRVDVAMSHKFRCELMDSKTGVPMAQSQRREALTVLFEQMAHAMGVDRFAETPVERLDQFSVMSVANNHDTGGLLRSLVNSFMIAYSDPATSGRAFEALLKIEALRAEVAEARGQSSQKQGFREAALELESLLTKTVSGHSAATPRFRILAGPDRLFVVSTATIEGLPTKVQGILIQAIVEEALAKPH